MNSPGVGKLLFVTEYLRLMLVACESFPVGPRISYSWSASYRITSNGSHIEEEESPYWITASGGQINETLDVDDVFPQNNRQNKQLLQRMSRKSSDRERRAVKSSLFGETVEEAKADHDKRLEKEKEIEDSEEEFDLSPEIKVKIYMGVIMGTIFLILFVMCIWPIFKCCRTCCRIGTTGCLACWDVCHCRDPGYRFMCLAARQAGLDPPSPEEYDNFITRWEDKAPELMEALME